MDYGSLLGDHFNSICTVPVAALEKEWIADFDSNVKAMDFLALNFSSDHERLC